MTITHKVLVNKDTGKIIPPVYLIDGERPCPPDCEYIPLDPNSAAHKLLVSGDDVSHLNMQETFWDFEQNKWVEVPSTVTLSLDQVKGTRNFLLKQSDLHFLKETDVNKKAQWLEYRAALRDFFLTIDEDSDLTTIVWPRTPLDLEALYAKANSGDVDAQEIISKEGL